jgi:hypothetical protein
MSSSLTDRGVFLPIQAPFPSSSVQLSWCMRQRQCGTCNAQRDLDGVVHPWRAIGSPSFSDPASDLRMLTRGGGRWLVQTVTDDWACERDASRPALGSHKSAGGTAGLAGRRSRVCSRPAGCSNLKAAVAPGVASAGYAYCAPRGEVAMG